jgi:hypothetical protein
MMQDELGALQKQSLRSPKKQESSQDLRTMRAIDQKNKVWVYRGKGTKCEFTKGSGQKVRCHGDCKSLKSYKFYILFHDYVLNRRRLCNATLP